MKTAIITGASSGIGRKITEKLLGHGFYVIGIARTIEHSFESERFTAVKCDLQDRKALKLLIDQIDLRGRELSLLINAAGVGYFAPHEEIQPEKICEIIDTNLLAPLLLTRGFLRELKEHKGHLINIASITARKDERFSAAYAASKAGLLHFSEALYEEVRKSGVKITTIIPDITKTPFYEQLSFEQDSDPLSYIEPECIANAVINIISQREGSVITELVIRPQLLKIHKKPGLEHKKTALY